MVDIVDGHVVGLLVHVYLFAYVEIEATTVVGDAVVVLVLLVVIPLTRISRPKIPSGQHCTVRVGSPVPNGPIPAAVLENPFGFAHLVVEVLGVLLLLFYE